MPIKFITEQQYKSDKLLLHTQQKGFTLIELMVVIMIVAILAAIAIPSYRRYVIQNAEDEAKAQMQQIQLQLERWRASQLSYKGFQPKIGVDNDSTSATYGEPLYGYNDANNTQINVPLGSTNPRYVITLVDATNTTNSLVQASSGASTSVSPSVARSWKMLAVPNTAGSIGYDGQAFILASTGERCTKEFGRNLPVDITATCINTDEAW